MTCLDLLPLLLLAAAATLLAKSLRRLRAIKRSAALRALLSEARGVICDAPDGIGISLLRDGIAELSEVENLLTAEYVRFEVIVVMNRDNDGELFEALMARYQMIPVEHRPIKGFGPTDLDTPAPDRTFEASEATMRSLCRSRRRCYRRLLLVDAATTIPHEAWRVALAVATYDYLLPTRRGCYLTTGALCRLATALALHEGTGRRVEVSGGVPLQLLSRRALLRASGFSLPFARRHRDETLIRLWEPLAYRRVTGSRWRLDQRRRRARYSRTLVTLLIASATLTALVAEAWGWAAFLLTLGALGLAERCSRKIFLHGAEALPEGHWHRYDSLFVSILERIRPIFTASKSKI